MASKGHFNQEVPSSQEEGASFPIEHISYSSIGLLERCPRAFYNSYILGQKSRPNWKMITGSAFDETLNYHYIQKKATGNDEPIDVLQDHVAEEFKLRVDGADWDGIATKQKTDQGKVLTACTRGIKAFREEILIKVVPSDSQVEIYHEFTPGLKFKGYVDLIEDGKGRQIIVDNKTTWMNWKGSEKLWQLVVYSYMLKLQGINIRELRYDVCRLKKRDDPVITQFTDFATDAQYEFMARKLEWAVNFLSAATKNPQMFNYNFTSWQCGASCAYVDQCEQETGMKLK
jgi:hypothetical protein